MRYSYSPVKFVQVIDPFPKFFGAWSGYINFDPNKFWKGSIQGTIFPWVWKIVNYYVMQTKVGVCMSNELMATYISSYTWNLLDIPHEFSTIHVNKSLQDIWSWTMILFACRNVPSSVHDFVDRQYRHWLGNRTKNIGFLDCPASTYNIGKAQHLENVWKCLHEITFEGSGEGYSVEQMSPSLVVLVLYI